MLPLFAEYDEETVQRAAGSDRIKPRPAFHYRLPDCHIDRDGWSLSQSWDRWCVVEALADDEEALERLTAEFELDYRGLMGVDRKAWVARIDEWIRDRELV